jgi:hypothetical protein
MWVQRVLEEFLVFVVIATLCVYARPCVLGDALCPGGCCHVCCAACRLCPCGCSLFGVATHSVDLSASSPGFNHLVPVSTHVGQQPPQAPQAVPRSGHASSSGRH